jgi:hypothetical protein
MIIYCSADVFDCMAEFEIYEDKSGSFAGVLGPGLTS